MTRINDVPTISWADEGQGPRLQSLLRNSKALLSAIEAIPEETLSMGERKLEKKIRLLKADGIFPRELGLLKIRFWDEYRLACREKRMMRMEDVYHGVCMPDYWHRNVLNNQMQLAWLIMPPADEITAQKEIIALGMKKLRDVFDLDIYKEVDVSYKALDDGELSETVKVKKVKVPDLPLIREMHAIVKTMQDRVQGSVIERKAIDQRITANVKTLPPPPPMGLDGVQRALPIEKKQISLASPDLTLDDLIEFNKQLEETAKNLSETEKRLTPHENDTAVEGEIIE